MPLLPFFILVPIVLGRPVRNCGVYGKVVFQHKDLYRAEL